MSSALPAGIITPLVTFISRDGTLDKKSTEALVDFQIDGGVAGLIAVGSTGELGHLTIDERAAVVSAVVAAARHRVPVWAGVSELGTGEAVRSARCMVDAGADALLVMPPMFFDVSDTELSTHFQALAKAVSVPIVAYDVPPRTPRKLPNELVASLAADGVIAGIKDSSGDINQARLLFRLTRQAPAFRSYAGSELTIDVALDVGFDGAVPGLANIAPHLASELFDAHRRRDYHTRSQRQEELIDLFDVVHQQLSGASFSAQAIGALKVATASRIGAGNVSMTAPFADITPAFEAAVRRLTTLRLDGDGSLPQREGKDSVR